MRYTGGSGQKTIKTITRPCRGAQKVKLTFTDRKKICKTLRNVKEMLTLQQVIDLGELAFWDLLCLEGHVSLDYPGGRKIYHALSYTIHLRGLGAGLGDEMPSDAEEFDYVDYYLKQLPLEAKFEAFVSLLDKTISLCKKGCRPRRHPF